MRNACLLMAGKTSELSVDGLWLLQGAKRFRRSVEGEV